MKDTRIPAGLGEVWRGQHIQKASCFQAVLTQAERMCLHSQGPISLSPAAERERGDSHIPGWQQIPSPFGNKDPLPCSLPGSE